MLLLDMVMLFLMFTVVTACVTWLKEWNTRRQPRSSGNIHQIQVIHGSSLISFSFQWKARMEWNKRMNRWWTRLGDGCESWWWCDVRSGACVLFVPYHLLLTHNTPLTNNTKNKERRKNKDKTNKTQWKQREAWFYFFCFFLFFFCACWI